MNKINPSLVLQKIIAESSSDAPTKRFVALNYNLWPIHVFTNLHILKLTQDLGLDALFVQTNIGSRPSYFHPYLSRRDSKLKNLLKELNIPNYEIKHWNYKDIVLDPEASSVLSSIRNIRNLAELKKLTWAGRPVGYSLSSSIVSQFYSTEIPASLIRFWAKKHFYSYIQGYQDAQYFHLNFGYSNFIIFNGRFPAPRGVKDYASEHNLLVIAHDISPDNSKFTFLTDAIHSPSSAIKFEETIESIMGEELKLEKMENFYSRRLNRETESVSRYSIHWESNSKTERPKKPYIAIYTSSDQEHFSINPERDFEDGQTQMEWLCNITRLLLSENFAVAIRIHPNSEISLGTIRKKWLKEFSKHSGFYFFDQKSSINSYDLARESEVVITTFSTIAAECAFSGIPVINTGYPTYDMFINLDKCRKIEDLLPLVRRLVSSIQDSSRRDELKKGALRYANFQTYRFFDFEFTPNVSEVDDPTAQLDSATRAYRDLRHMNRIERFLTKSIYYLKYKVLRILMDKLQT